MLVHLDDLPKVANQILAQLSPGDVLALSGPLAAGKTTLTQAILKVMGYGGKVTSPTFVLEKHYPVEYQGINEVVHLDFYRLQPDELKTFGWQDYLGNKQSLTIIEWPERGKEYLPPETKTITITVINEQTRRFHFWDSSSF